MSTTSNHLSKASNKRTLSSAFTIVELLIVIVIIGVLAAITIVSYTSITSRAVASSLKSDLANATNQLKIFQVENSVYPDTIDCGSPDSNTNKCVKPSLGNIYKYSSNANGYQAFCLTATKDNQSFNISNNNTIKPGICPIGWWALDGDANDSSGKGAHGLASGALAVSGVIGQAYSFDGINDDKIDISKNYGTLSNYTIAFWAKHNIAGRMPISSNVNASFYWYGDYSWAYNHGGVAGEYYYPRSVSIPYGTWGHFCVTYDGTKVSIYRNGTLEGSQASSGSASFGTGFFIGGYSVDPSYKFDGSIDDIRFYDVALSAKDVKGLYDLR